MASFRIHEDQENASLRQRKENVDMYSTTTQRRALGDLNQFAFNHNRNIKPPVLANVPCKIQDENRALRQIKNEKNIVPPVAQFRAFSVYEDKPTEAELKKREPTFKPFVAQEIRKENNYFVSAAENLRVQCAKIAKQPALKDIPPPNIPLLENKEPFLEKIKPFQDKNNEVESPMSVADSSVLSLSISNNDSQVLEEICEEDEDKATAQTDRDMFFHVVEYRDDIYKYMREIEVKHRANPRYMRKQPDITPVMRSILIDWLVEVCDEYNQQNETLHLAVSYVDRFLSYISVVRTKLQLVGTAATYIASKFEEVYPPEITEFVYITDDTYTKREVLRMEHLILKVLSFDLSTPTSLAFLSHYCISNGLSKKIFHLASYIAELSLLEADPYLQYTPSTIAAAALATARHCLLCTCGVDKTNTSMSALLQCAATAWPAALSRTTGYQFTDIEPCVRELMRTHTHASQQPYQAIPDKYKGDKFLNVSTISPRPMFPVAKYTPPAPAAANHARPSS